jgi:hypothetical protein
MFGISTIRGHPIHYRCLKPSWLVSTNQDETVWLASQLSSLSCCSTDLSQLSQAVVPFAMRSSFDKFVVFFWQLHFVKYKYLWILCILILLLIIVTDICWVLITEWVFYVEYGFRYSWLFYCSQSRTSRLHRRVEGSGGAVFNCRSLSVISVTTANLNYYFCK